MKPMYVGFAIDPEEKTVLVCCVKENYYDAVESTQSRAGNKVQRVFDLPRDIAGLHNWLLRNGITRREAKNVIASFTKQLKECMK